MKIEKTFTIKAPSTAVWAFLTDPRRVASALPGAAITEQIDPATYAGTITVKVGPISTSYRGKMHFERLDAPSGTAEIVASGQDVRGKGGAQLRMTSRVSERTPGQTEVNVESDVMITGLLAQMGRGMIEDVSNQMFERFSGAMQTELEPAQMTSTHTEAGSQTMQSDLHTTGPAIEEAAGDGRRPIAAAPSTPPAVAAGPTGSGAAPIEVMSFGGKLVARAAGRTVRRPSFWVALIVLMIVVYWIWLR